MQQPLKRQILSVFALVALAAGGFFAAEYISNIAEVKLKKQSRPAHELSMPSKVNWVSAHRASIEALDENKPILCFFTAHGSADCRKLEQEFFTDTTVYEYINKNFVPVIIIDNDALPETAPEKVVKKNYGINTVPTLIVTDPDGHLIDQSSACTSLSENFAFLKKHTKLHPPDKSSPIHAAKKFDSAATTSSDPPQASSAKDPAAAAH